jgi:acetylornithine/N-succinyldiaminopimelate aminotransferase
MTDTNRDWLERFQEAFLPNYRPAELVIVRGEGSYVFDVEGKRYLDMVAGIAVSALGHGHPRLVEALVAQAHRILHTSNLYMNQPSIELAERLCAASFGEAVFFCNSGAEANEAAIKLARRYAFDRKEPRTQIVAFEQSFHGRTLGALAATGQPKYHEGFGPMPADFIHVPYGDLDRTAAVVGAQTAAVLVEPIQGEGGVRVPPSGFLAELRALTASRGALLIVDEIQVGVGRTGAMFCHQTEDVVPDVMTLAKGLGGGLPIGALVTTRAIGASLVYGTHGTTFGGNPMACAGGCVVMDALSDPALLSSVRSAAERLQRGLRSFAGRHPIAEVRGRGLLIGIELTGEAGFAAADVVRACRERGVLVHVAGPRVVRLAPPLTVGEAEIDEALHAVDQALAALRPTP